MDRMQRRVQNSRSRGWRELAEIHCTEGTWQIQGPEESEQRSWSPPVSASPPPDNPSPRLARCGREMQLGLLAFWQARCVSLSNGFDF